MTFRATIFDLKIDAEILFPISMNQPLERGERLQAIVNAIKEKNYQDKVTILICDYLNRHNKIDEISSLQEGDEFVRQHQEILTGFKIVHWKDFIDSRSEEFNFYLNDLTQLKETNTVFSQKLYRTWKRCLKSNQTLENSINYQIEEYAALLCSHQFDYQIYPMKISDGMSFLYQYAINQKIKVPQYIHVKILHDKAPVGGFFKNPLLQESPKKNQNLHIAFRGVLAQVDLLMASEDLSKESKIIFVDSLQNIFLMNGLVDIDFPSLNSDKPIQSPERNLVI